MGSIVCAPVAVFDAADVAFADAKLSRQESAGHAARRCGPDCKNSFTTEFAFRVTFADGVLAPLNRILCVFSLGARNQMAGIDARRVVA